MNATKAHLHHVEVRAPLFVEIKECENPGNGIFVFQVGEFNRNWCLLVSVAWGLFTTFMAYALILIYDPLSEYIRDICCRTSKLGIIDIFGR